MQDPHFKQAIEQVKLRSPIEDVVRDRIPELKRQGALYVACCPFHEERTPSFKVDPRRGSWHCFGACSTGGDVISFVERFDNLSFREALELLASAVGVELPGRAASRADDDRRRSLYEVVERALRFYIRRFNGEDGRAARDYLAGRGLEPGTLEAFDIGWAPPRGNPLFNEASSSGIPIERLTTVGLVRTSDDGRPYDFFRGRLLIPIRDHLGRAVGFGGRLLGSESAGSPKYVNTADTQLFHKGRLIFGFDRALPHVRRTHRLILVEGYTDVMAAHQVGLSETAAVLGTATTEDHAALVRRSGARCVYLVFDGDDAGRQAAWRALDGLLPLEIELKVVVLPGGADPCDLLLREGLEAFEQRLEQAPEWFAFLVDGLRGLSASALGREVDRVLELLAKLGSPVHRDARIAELARELSLPESGVREQWMRTQRRQRPQRRATSRTTDAQPAAEPDPGGEEPGQGPAIADPKTRRADRRAFGELLGACLLDNSLIPGVAPAFEGCTERDLLTAFSALLELYESEDDEPLTGSRLLSALGDDPAREMVVPVENHALRAENPCELADGAMSYLRRRSERKSIQSIENELRGLGSTDDPNQKQRALRELHQRLRDSLVPVPDRRTAVSKNHG